MPILETIDTILKLIQEGKSNYSDDLNNFACTLEALHQNVKTLGEKNIPIDLFEKLFSELKESRDIVKRLLQVKSWWKNITNYLPGSDIHKLRTKNDQLVQDLNSVHAILNIQIHKHRDAPRASPTYLTKPSAEKNEGEEDGDLDFLLKKINNELNSSQQSQGNRSETKQSASSSKHRLMTSPTAHDLRDLLEEPGSKDMDIERNYITRDSVAFQLKMLYETKVFDEVVDKKIVPEIESWWEGDFARYRIERANFKFLPDALSSKISREHATIVGYRVRHKAAEEVGIELLSKQNEEGGVIGHLFGSLIEGTQPDGEEDKANGSPVSKGTEERHFAIYDESPNKIYVLKEHKYGLITSAREKIEGQFRKLGVGERMELNHLDIIAIKLDFKQREMIFGFQFIVCENVPANGNADS